jgi:hypothetical protein
MSSSMSNASSPRRWRATSTMPARAEGWTLFICSAEPSYHERTHLRDPLVVAVDVQDAEAVVHRGLGDQQVRDRRAMPHPMVVGEVALELKCTLYRHMFFDASTSRSSHRSSDARNRRWRVARFACSPQPARRRGVRLPRPWRESFGSAERDLLDRGVARQF